MAKATGKLVSAKEKLFSDDIAKGDTVTIELPKGMKVIGNCRTCAEYEKSIYDLRCVLKYGFTHDPSKFGCREWRENNE